MGKTILITANTWLKQSARQAVDLPDDAKLFVRSGDRFEVKSHEPIESLGDDGDQHIQFSLLTPVAGRFTWLVYQRHASVLDGDTLLYPCPEVDAAASQCKPSSQPYKGKQFRLPSGTIAYADQPIIRNGSFCWGEATHNLSRIPKTAEHEKNIIKLATTLQRVRDELGVTHVTSWYRPEPFNSRVGGARNSQHLGGKAVDIVIHGYTGREMARRVLNWWPGGVGIYPGDRQHILHLDIGPKRSWGL